MATTNRYEFEHQLLAKAFTDRLFMAYLQGDPKGAVQKFLGTALPATVNVKVLVEDPHTLYALLPHPSHDFLGSLTQPQLAANAREQFESALVTRMGADPAFQQQLRADPTGTVRTMAPLPADVTVQLAEEPADTVYIVIPYYGQSTYRV